MMEHLERGVHSDDSHGSSGEPSPIEKLQHMIDHAAHLLPAQGPIQVFIHHNTLHAFEHLPFDEAVQRGAGIFGTQPYLTEERYRAALVRGRIRLESLRDIVERDLGNRSQQKIAGLVTRFQLRMTMLEQPLWNGTAAELRWWMAELSVLKQFSPDISAAVRNRLMASTRRWVLRDGRSAADSNWLSKLTSVRLHDIEQWSDATWQAATLEGLWSVCHEGLTHAEKPIPTQQSILRHRDYLLAVTGQDCDIDVNELLIRYSAAFVDQGVSYWSLPNRKEGYFKSFLRMYLLPKGPPNKWILPLRAEADRLLTQGSTALESVLESFELLGVPESEWEEYLAATLLALRGWGGIIRQMEIRGDRIAHAIPSNTLLEFVAVRLLLDRLAAAHLAKREGYTTTLANLRTELKPLLPKPRTITPDERVILVFQLAQVFGWTPQDLQTLSAEQWHELYAEVEGFPSIERRRLFHKAYEMRFRDQTLDAASLHTRRPVPAPLFQVVTCLDEREESFRRHLEEVAPECETFGAAGFFNVAIYYRGAADAHFVPLCPIVLTPQHWVEEQVQDTYADDNLRKARNRKAVAAASHRFHVGTRSPAAGAILTAGLGVLASIPLVCRILFPGISGRISNWIGSVVRPPQATVLKLERTDPKAGPENGHVGYINDEMAATAERLLRDIGMTKTFGRFVFILGHGSRSLNNPHKSAYDCGACGGSPGAPNGRALAQMLNDPQVRLKIAKNGITIPADTFFIGGYHNTCDDSVQLFDLDRIPESHRAELAKIEQAFDEACNRNAHERARRFMSAPLDQSTVDARRHVINRSEDLAQTRPELGHATNAICYVGRRERTRGLYLDRRAFLTSYDPTQDDAIGSTLMRLMGAAVPVCAGINLEYYFSHVDSPGYGCGTKLPHNVTSLVGVMDGAASDLRTGLPWQMVEIHEPVRLLFIVETTPEMMLGLMDRNEVIGRTVRNGWVQMAVIDPESGQIQIYEDNAFHPYTLTTTHLPQARSSADWYRGWREHLEFAVIG